MRSALNNGFFIIVVSLFCFKLYFSCYITACDSEVEELGLA